MKIFCYILRKKCYNKIHFYNVESKVNKCKQNQYLIKTNNFFTSRLAVFHIFDF